MMQKINQLAQLTTKKQENELISGYINSIHYNLQSSPHFSTKISWCSEIVSQTTIHLLIHSKKTNFTIWKNWKEKKWPDVPWFLGVLQQRGTRQCAWCDKTTSFFLHNSTWNQKKKEPQYCIIVGHWNIVEIQRNHTIPFFTETKYLLKWTYFKKICCLCISQMRYIIV